MSFTPKRSVITDITQAMPAVVTTNSAHNLTTGQVVRIRIPPSCGMQGLSGRLFSITSLTSNTFSLQGSQCPVINTDTREEDAFSIPVGEKQIPESLAVGSGSTPLTGNYVQVMLGECATKVDDATTNVEV